MTDAVVAFIANGEATKPVKQRPLFILRQGMMVVFSGVASGAVLAFLVARVLSRFLYGVSANDPLSLGGAALVLLSVAFVACYLPARNASRVDPLIALQHT